MNRGDRRGRRETSGLRKNTLFSSACSAISAVKNLIFTCCTGVLRNDRSTVAGVVIANKAGSQAVIAGTVIDATPTAAVVQMAGAKVTGWPEAPLTVSRTLFKSSGGHEVGDYREFTMDITMADGSWPERQRADVRLRTTCDRGDAAWSAHVPYLIEPNAIVAERELPSVPSPEEMRLDCCRPKDVDHLYVLSAMCAVPRAEAQRLVRPLALMRLGRRVGLAAAEDARQRETVGPVRVQATSPERPASAIEAREALAGHRPCRDYGRIPRPEGSLPVWGEYDVVVVGGGTAGAAAAIGAARRGARTLGVEMLGALGGTATNGIGRFWHGNVVGFAASFAFEGRGWTPSQKARWLLNELTVAGGDVWFNTLTSGVLMSGNQVRGITVATPMGAGAVLAKVVIDASGDADVCAWAGAEYLYSDDGNLDFQEAGCHGDAETPTGYQNDSTTCADPSDIEGLGLIAAESP